MDLLVKPEGLEPRETQVMAWLATGATDQEIARHLVISPKTVAGHCGEIYGKLCVKTRTEAVVRALQLGILPMPEVIKPADLVFQT